MTEDRKTQTKAAIRDGVDHAADAAHDKAREATDRITQEAGDRVSNAADAAAAASAEFEAGSLQAQATQQVAAHLTDVANRISRTDFDQAAGKVTQFARENPLMFLGGAALLGFAAARFLKASDRHTAVARTTAEDPWMGYVSAADAAPQPAAPTPQGDPMSRGYTNGRADA